MKKSTQWRIIAVLILVAIAIVDALSFFVPIAAIAAIALLLFRPKWLFHFFEKLYDKETV
jgi:hypothetical protein